MAYLAYSKAKQFVCSLGIKTHSEWRKYCKRGNKPQNIPSTPSGVYRNEWKGWGDFLGTNKKAQFKGPYRSFESAKKYIQSLGLKNQQEWAKYAKGESKPEDIPAGPARVYKVNGWKGYGDWLGTGRIANQQLEFLPFTEAKKIVNSLGLKNRAQWRAYLESGKKPAGIPANPGRVYGEYWKGYGDWLGTGAIAPFKRQFRPFEEAREFAQSLSLKGQQYWYDYCKSHKLRPDIPAFPPRVYKNEWKGWGDWLGTGNIAASKRKYRSFEEAKKFVHALGLHGRSEWEKYCKSGQKPDDIPYQGRQTYKKYWKGWGDWLGTGTIANFEREFLPFEKARDFVRKLNFKTQSELRLYYKSGNKPADIPSTPERVYESNWKGFGDWLGTGRTRDFRPFEEARKFARSLGLKNKDDWSRYTKSAMKPGVIPGDPRYVYKDKWKSWGDWLGTDFVAHQLREYRPFQEARSYARSLGLKNQHEWRRYAKSKNKPGDIPTNPHAVYQEWTNWFDWFGIENKDWSITRIKSLLKGLIESRVIFDWDEAVLYSLLLRKGLLNISGNRHEIFFKNLVQAARTNEGRTAIENYIYSESDIPLICSHCQIQCKIWRVKSR